MKEQTAKLAGHLCFVAAGLFSVIGFLLPREWVSSLVMNVLSLFFCLVAAGCYAKSKGRSRFWFVLGFLGPFGLILLLVGPNFSKEAISLENKHRSEQAAKLAGIGHKE
jgi:energy-coupling factor transporter transmembrane protein EcfT